MKTALYNSQAKKIGEIDLPKNIFEVPMNYDLVHQVILVQRANRKQKTAKAKDRSEVRGGGKKPWRQKGTGRARHGSIRSPLWRGGGVTFGPVLEKNLKKKIPLKMRRKALFMILSAKAKDNEIFVLDNLEPEKLLNNSVKTESVGRLKTKLMNEILSKFIKKSRGLLILPKLEKEIIRTVRNIDRVGVIEAREVNPLDLVNYKYLLMPKDSIKVIENTFKI